VKFIRSGPKILLLEPNVNFRATSGDEAAKAAVRDAFAQSVLCDFKVAAENGDTVLVDVTDLFLQDWHHIVPTLMQTGQGNYKLDPNRSAIFLPRTRDFPDNSEFEAVLTYTGTNPGKYMMEVVPSPTSMTVHEHYSFVKLPDDGYKPREFDPRAGISISSIWTFLLRSGRRFTRDSSSDTGCKRRIRTQRSASR